MFPKLWKTWRHSVGCSVVLGLICSGGAWAQGRCSQTVFLALETGHMGTAARVADILRRQDVRATFFAAQESTQAHDGSLGNVWGTWWKSMAGQGHAFASFTFDHVTWQADLPGYKPLFRVQLGAGTFAGRSFTYDPAKYCSQIDKAARRLEDFTEVKSLPLVRPPAGRFSPRVEAAANACGYAVVAQGTSAGAMRFWNLDNMPTPASIVREVQGGDILTATLGGAPRLDAWQLEQLEPMLAGLKARGLCFATLRDHPGFKPWMAAHGG